MERSRLLDRLSDARLRTCIWIQGPAGAGKTTLALQWRAQMVPFGYEFAWCSAGADEDAESLLEGVFSSLRRIDPAIVDEATFIYNRDGELRASDTVAIPVLNGLMRHSGHLVLVVDDCHNINDPRAHKFLQTLLDFAPQNFHLMLLSRSTPTLSLSRLREDSALVELDFSDLRFTFSEAETFLRAHCPDLRRRDARLLYDQTDGWGAGLRLVSLNRGLRFPGQSSRQRIQNASEFAAYFNQEVLSQLPDAELATMARLSVTKRFNDALCASLFGSDAGASLMNRLRRDNMFLIPVEGNAHDVWFRFHPLFRDVMRERFEKLPLAVRQATHAHLGDWFGKRKHLFEAVSHCVAANDNTQAADWVERYASEMFLAGEMRRLVRAIAALPESELITRISLRLWVAWSQLCYRRLIDCERSVEALRGASEDANTDARHHLTLLQGSLAVQREDTEAGERLIPDIERMPTTRDPVLAGGRRNMLGWLHIRLGNFAVARDILTRPVPYLEVGAPLLDSAFGLHQSRCLYGLSYLREGDMREAERVLQDVVVAADSACGMFSEPACNAAALLSAVLYETNRIEGLRTLLDPRSDVIERICLPEASICAAVSRIRLHSLDGRHAEAQAELDQLDEQAHRRGLSRMHGYALAERTRLFMRMGRTSAATEQLNALRAMAGKPHQSATDREVDALALWTEAHWSAWRDEPDRALELLSLLDARGAWRGQKRKQVQIDAFAALLEDRLGQPLNAQRRVVRMVAQSRELGLVRSVLDFGERLLDLGDIAQRAGVLTPSSSFYLEHLKLLLLRQAPAPVSSIASAQQRLSARELEVLRSMALSMSNKRVAQALGISPETVKWHLKNIYGKLEVYGRDDAVAKARKLGWIETPGRTTIVGRSP